MKIALVQQKVIPGKLRHNTNTILEYIGKAKDHGCDMVVFPEMCISGYFVGDKWTDPAFIKSIFTYQDIIKEASQEITVVIGGVCTFNGKTLKVGEDGRQVLLNAAIVYKNGEDIGVYPKTNLPNYRYFDDKRYFTSKKNLPSWKGDKSLKINQIKFGFLVCEDLWSKDYSDNPAEYSVKDGAKVLIDISCSPWNPGKNESRNKRVKELKQSLGKKSVPLLYVNTCGVQNNGKNILVFDGDTGVYDKDGNRNTYYDLSPFEEGISIVEIDNKGNLTNAPKVEPMRPYYSEIRMKYRAIIEAYRSMDDMLGWKPNYIFGLSGGIDSAVTCALAVDAVGPERVFAYNLPSEFNSDKTKTAAKQLADALGISYKVHKITDLYEENLLTLVGTDTSRLTSLVLENIQAKIRGTSILSNIAAMMNGVMVNNGNKLEIATGYATLYGDVDGVFSPIGDLTKEEVYELAYYINAVHGDQIIPQELFPVNDLYDFGDNIAPSAELKEAQLDPIKIGYHDKLLKGLTGYFKESIETIAQAYEDNTLLNKFHIDPRVFQKYDLWEPSVFFQDLEWFISSIQKSVFKRIQAPPIVVLSKTAFGYDLRESQLPLEWSVEYLDIKHRILDGEKAI